MRPYRLRSLIPAALVGMLGFAGPATAQVAALYTLTDLTPATGAESSAFGINAAGVVVGYSGTPGGTHQATRWTAGVGTLLPNLPGDVFSEARGINAAGTVVGFSSSGLTGANSTGDKAVTWTGIVPTNLLVNSAAAITAVTGPALTGSRGEAISATGEVVGHAYSGTFLALGAADGIRGFYRSAGGAVTRLDPSTNANYPADAALSYGINASSQVFGQSDPGGAGAGFRASRWAGPSGSSSTPFTYPTVGASPATDYLGFKGNNANRIVGTAETIVGGLATGAQAFGADVTNGTTLLNNLAGATFGVANAISNAAINIIVGGSGSNFGPGAELATAWEWNSASTTPNLTAINLNTRLVSNPSNITLVEALDVNDLGQIVGYGFVNGNPNVLHGFLLTPVPEPGTLALCGVAFGGLGLRAWRRRKSAV